MMRRTGPFAGSSPEIELERVQRREALERGAAEALDVAPVARPQQRQHIPPLLVPGAQPAGVRRA